MQRVVQVTQAPLDHRVVLGPPDLLVTMGQSERQALRVRSVLLEQTEFQEQPVQLVREVIQDREVQRDSRDLLDLQVALAVQVKPAQVAALEQLVLLAGQDRLVFEDLLAELDQKASEEIPGLLGQLELLAFRVQLDWQVSGVNTVTTV